MSFPIVPREQSPIVYPGPEIWNVEAGKLTHQGKVAIMEDAFADAKSPKGSGANTPVRSRLQTPAGSASGGEEQESTKEEKVKEVHTIQGDTNNATLSQNPANNDCMITPTSIKLQRWYVKMAFPKG